MTKNVLVLVGSNNDIDNKGQPTKFTNDLTTTIEKINEANPDKQISMEYFDSCSADRVPYFLPSVVNETKFDGVIYSGGCSLVLGAAIQEALSHVRSTPEIEDFRQEAAEAIKNQPGKPFIPGNYNHNLITRKISNYYFDPTFIPTIGVPGTDKPSGGVTALTSIVENPPGCEPRPVVGLGRIDTAIRSMHKMLYGMENGFDLVTIAYEAGTQEAAETLRKKLDGLGYKRASTIPYQDIALKPFEQRPDEIVMFVGDKSYNAPLITDAQTLDGRVNFMINCPAQKDMSHEWTSYLKTLTQLNNTISVGVGNYDNAAILAAQLLNKPEVNEKMWEYRNGKTLSGVINKPLWLQNGKARRE